MSGEHTEQINEEPSTKAKNQYLHGQIGFWAYGEEEISEEIGHKIANFIIDVMEKIKEEENLGDIGSRWVLAPTVEHAADAFASYNLGKEEEGEQIKQ